MNNTSKIILLLHGLGATPITMWPLEKYLNTHSFSNTHRMYYPVDSLPLIQQCVDYIDQNLPSEISDLNKDTDSISIIGQSMGGVVGSLLHQKGWNIDILITIGSPLKGARFIKHMQNNIKDNIYQSLLHKPMYNELLKLSDNPLSPPPHPYFCFTMSWFNTNWDGAVYIDEAKFDDQYTSHISWTDHRTVFLDPRLFSQVLSKLYLHDD